MWTLLHRRADGSFVIRRDGYPYHVIESDPLFAEVAAAAEGVDLPPEPQPEPPPPQPVTDVSFWQFMLAAASLNIITLAEAEAAVDTRAMPALFAATLDTLPEPQRTMARIKFKGITRVVRSDDLFALMVSTGAATDEQIDGVFAVAATIT
jgi:hypothetical protein